MSTHPNEPFDSDDDEPDAGEQPQGAIHHEYSEGMEEETPSYSTYAPYPSPKRWVLRIAIFVMFASAVGVGIWFWVVRGRMQEDFQLMSQRGRDFVEGFLDDLRSERFDQAYRSTTPAFKQRMTQKQLEELVAKHKETLAEPFKDHEFIVPPTAMTAFGKPVTGEYRGKRKLVAGAKEEVLIKVIREAGVLKVEEMSVTR